MKPFIILFSAILALNAQAGSIAWKINDTFVEGWNTSPPDILIGLQIHIFIVLDDVRQGAFDALNNGILPVSTPGVLDNLVLIKGYVSSDIHYTPDRPDIIAGQEYNVGILALLYLTPFGSERFGGIDALWHYFTPKVTYADASPYIIDFKTIIADGFFTAPIPEPATGLLALGGIALLLRRKRN